MGLYKVFIGLGLGFIAFGLLWPATMLQLGVPHFVMPSANTNRFIVMMVFMLAWLLLFTERVGRWALAALVVGGVGLLYRGIGMQALMHDLGTMFLAIGLRPVANVLFTTPSANGPWLALMVGIGFVVAAAMFSPQKKRR